MVQLGHISIGSEIASTMPKIAGPGGRMCRNKQSPPQAAEHSLKGFYRFYRSTLREIRPIEIKWGLSFQA
jgi:hypothetical protein